MQKQLIEKNCQLKRYMHMHNLFKHTTLKKQKLNCKIDIL